MPQNCIEANSDEVLNGLDVYLSYTSVVVTPLLLVLGQCGHDSPVTFEVFALNNPSTIIQSWYQNGRFKVGTMYMQRQMPVLMKVLTKTN